MYSFLDGFRSEDPRWMGPMYKTAWTRFSYLSLRRVRNDFFQKYPDQRARPLVNAPVNLDLLEKVNRQVDRRITFTLDGFSADTPDSWDISPSEGDCDDRVMTKRYILNKVHGIPLGALNPLIGTQRVIVNNILVLHMMLCVSTSEGDFIMNDQPRSMVVPWQEIKDLLQIVSG